MRSLCLALLAAVAFAGCDQSADDPAVSEVFLIGTRVDPGFLTTGAFELIATPLGADGASILSETVEGSVVLTAPQNAQAATRFGQVNGVTDAPLFVALVIDESGSMSSTDPKRLRVSGATRFIERLDRTPQLDWQAILFGYSSTTRVIEDFTSNVDTLRIGLDTIRSTGSTRTYGALTESLERFDPSTAGASGAASARKAIVLFSDGQPNDANRRADVCAEAVRLGVPIFSIGLGPASDLSADSDVDAVEEMRAIANCSRAAYAGIAPDDPTAIETIYVSIATAAAQGSLTYTVTLSGPGFASLEAGQRVQGTVTLTNGGMSASAPFQFTVPASAPAARPGIGITD